MKTTEFRMFKFRAWSVREKKYIHPNNICINLLLDNRVFTRKRKYNSDVFEPAQHIILQQYIELKDINGVEIYEGDIIKSASGISAVKFGECMVNMQEYNAYGFYLDNENKELITKDDQEFFQVIGNIYENPELLEQTNEN